MSPEPSFETLEALLTAVDAAEDGYGVGLAFDGCPCFEVEVEGVTFHGHCWRVCSACDRAGLHVYGNLTLLARAVAALLREKLNRMDWYGDWELHFQSREEAEKQP